MTRAAELGGHAHERLTLVGVEAVGGERDGLPACQALVDGRVQKLLRTRVQLLGGNASGEQLANPGERELHGAILDDPLQKAFGLSTGGADDDQQAARRIAQPLGGPQHARVHGQAGRARRSAVAAGAVG